MSGGDVRFDVVVIGAGAAGMMCAAQAGQRGRRVLLIEHYPVLGEKIRISGGGRCNFTNVNAGPGNFLSPQSGFLPLGARALHAARFHRAGRAHGIALSREEARAALLRRHRARHHRDAEGGVRSRRRRLAHAVPGRRRRARRRRVSHRDADGRGARRIARHRHRRPHGAEDRRDAVRLPHRRAVRSCRRAAVAGAGAAGVAARGAGAATAISPASPSTSRSRAAAGAFARTCCSRIAGSPARRSCRFRRTGTAARRSSIDLLPGRRARAAWLIARARVDARASTRCSRERLPQRFAQAVVRGARASRCRCDSCPKSGCARSPQRLHRVAAAAVRHARLQQGRGDARRRRHARAVVARRWRRRSVPGPLLHRRSRRRHRLARRLQFPVGVVVGPRRRAARLTRARRSSGPRRFR